jgi:hypothetical protein
VVRIAVFVASLSLCSCAPLPVAAHARQQVVVTGPAATRDRHCSPREVAQLIADFLTNLQGGSIQLNRFVAPRPIFRWYSDNVSSGRIGLRRAENRSTLKSYLMSRYARRDYIALAQLALSPPQRGIGNFDFITYRTAADIPSDLPVTEGKGAVDCQTGRVIVWSMGGPVASAMGTLCPMPAKTSADQAVVCGRAK